MSQKIQKVTNVTKGIAGSHSILLLLFSFFFFSIISSNIFKIPYLQKNTTKHADKIKEYNTIFIVSLKKFILFQRLCHLHQSLHCTYICFCVLFIFCLFFFLLVFCLFFFFSFFSSVNASF